MRKIGLYIIFFQAISSVFAVDVTFNCDMNHQIQMEYFDAGTDIVDVPGSFNGWGEESIDLLADEDEDGIYTITISDLSNNKNNKITDSVLLFCFDQQTIVLDQNIKQNSTFCHLETEFAILIIKSTG